MLGVRKNADADQIKKAYRDLALKFHPDMCLRDHGKFKDINSAYAVHSTDEEGGSTTRTVPEGFYKRYTDRVFRGSNIEDLLKRRWE